LNRAILSFFTFPPLLSLLPFRSFNFLVANESSSFCTTRFFQRIFVVLHRTLSTPHVLRSVHSKLSELHVEFLLQNQLTILVLMDVDNAALLAETLKVFVLNRVHFSFDLLNFPVTIQHSTLDISYTRTDHVFHSTDRLFTCR
jgi:hypothetical protein